MNCVKFLQDYTYQLLRMISYIAGDQSDPDKESPQDIANIFHKVELVPFMTQIRQLSHNSVTYYVSYAKISERLSIFGNKCFLVIKKDQKDNCQIGYVEKALPKQFPMRWADPIFKNISSLKYSSQSVTIMDDKLSIKLLNVEKNKQDTFCFQFEKKYLLYKWIDLISELNGRQEVKQKQQKRMMHEEKEKLNEENKRIKQEYKSLRSKYKELVTKLELKQSTIVKQQQNWKILQSENEDLRRKHQESVQNHQQLRLQLANLSEKLMNKQLENIRLESQLRQMNETLSKRQAAHSEQVESMQTNINRLQRNVQSLKQDLSSSEKQYQTLKEQLESRRQSLLAISNEKGTLNNLCQSKQHQLEQSLQQIQHLKARLKYKSLQALFYNLLEDRQQEKEFLVSQIQTMTSKQIKKTKLLYIYDAQNKINFHHYIDDHPNIVIIIKTVNGSLIAGYSQQSIHPAKNGHNTGKFGLLASLSHKLSFPLYQGKKSVSYDEYYIIFGNAELQIKVSDLKLFSNFGITNGYFNPKGYDCKFLLGENTNQIEVQAYEIYEVSFVQ